MNFVVDVASMTFAKGDESKIREMVRILMFAHALDSVGHNVVIENCGHMIRHSEFWPFFAHMADREIPGKAVLVKSESIIKDDTFPGVEIEGRICFKSKVSTKHDALIMQYADILVAHEYDPDIEFHPRFQPIPFPVHHLCLQVFVKEGLFVDYLIDDLGRIRDRFVSDTKLPQPCGFIGFSSYNRKPTGWSMDHELCAFEFKEGRKYRPTEYLERLGQYRAGVVLQGDTPKTNRFSECVVLGLPVVITADGQALDPRLTKNNAILLDEWTDRDSLIEGLSNMKYIQANADWCYKNGWSPRSSALKAVERLIKIKGEGHGACQ